MTGSSGAMPRLWRISLWVLAAALAGPLPALAKVTQVIEKKKDMCAPATSLAERAEGVPSHLLRAISLAETGRWDEKRRASFAWPWTVTSGGEGRYYATKGEAVAEVRRLSSRGVRNIDVGCMQVNLLYHKDAFASLEEAFEPSTNTEYAARFLKDLYGSSGSWTTAAGFYHSRKPADNRPYRLKVIRLWNEARRAATENPSAAAAEATPGTTPAPSSRRAAAVAMSPPPASFDRARTAKLTAGFKAARAKRVFDRAAIRLSQIDAWREKRVRAMDYTHLAAMRRAEADDLRRKELYRRAAAVEKRAASLHGPRRPLARPAGY